MFSFRRRNHKKTASQSTAVIRASPSLPELSAQGIPWPSDWVDVSSLTPTDPNATPRSMTMLGPTRKQGKPSMDTVQSGATGAGAPTISSLYMSHPPSAFENRKSAVYQGRSTRPSQKRTRNPVTTFNIMVVGGQGTGKTSLLRLLLDTADISPTATAEQKANMERFLRGSPKRTDSIQSACVEICESKYDRLLLSVIDTPGLNFQNGYELKLERQVTSIVKYMDQQFADTLNEESKVVRQSKGDQHIHLIIYMVDAASIMTQTGRRALSTLPKRTRSETTIGHSNSPTSPTKAEETEDDEDEDEESWLNLTMSPADINVIQRLSKRANVLPVVARADSLTNDKLCAIKKVIRRDLAGAGLDFGVFGPAKSEAERETLKPDQTAKVNGNGNGVNGHHDKRQSSDTEEEKEDEPEERRSRNIIKLRPVRLPKIGRSRSRSRLELSEAVNGPAAADITDNESIASVRFSAQIIAKMDLNDSMPFALIAPEHSKRRRALKAPRPISSVTMSEDQHSMVTDGTAHSSVVNPSEDGHGSVADHNGMLTPTSPADPRHMPYLSGPPADLRGVFVRRFRWGTVDVLSPEHCDFAALRTAVLSTHMKMLKIRTKEVLYEKFRTEKLLARRATANIGEEETRRLLEDLGL